MSRSRPRFRRRFRRQKHEYIWTGTFVTADATLLDGDTDGLVLVDPDDWRRTTIDENLEKGAVLLRIVGDVRFRTETSGGSPSLGGASYIWGIVKRDVDDSAPLDLGTNFFGEDWLHLRAGSIPPNNATNIAYAPQPNWRHEEVDVGVKRKLTSDEKIEFHFTGLTAVGASSATETLVCDYFFRALIQLP